MPFFLPFFLSSSDSELLFLAFRIDCLFFCQPKALLLSSSLSNASFPLLLLLFACLPFLTGIASSLPDSSDSFSDDVTLRGRFLVCFSETLDFFALLVLLDFSVFSTLTSSSESDVTLFFPLSLCGCLLRFFVSLLFPFTIVIKSDRFESDSEVCPPFKVFASSFRFLPFLFFNFSCPALESSADPLSDSLSTFLFFLLSFLVLSISESSEIISTFLLVLQYAFKGFSLESLMPFIVSPLSLSSTIFTITFEDKFCLLFLAISFLFNDILWSFALSEPSSSELAPCTGDKALSQFFSKFSDKLPSLFLLSF